MKEVHQRVEKVGQALRDLARSSTLPTIARSQSPFFNGLQSSWMLAGVRDEAGQIVLHQRVRRAREWMTAFLDDLQQRSHECDGYVKVVEICRFDAWLLTLLKA